MYRYQQTNWPNFTWSAEWVSEVLGDLTFNQGKLLGKMGKNDNMLTRHCNTRH